MSWLSKEQPVLNVSDKDIEVYKILFSSDGYNHGYSLILGYTYTKEEINKNNEFGKYSFCEGIWSIEDGYHSYDGNCKFFNKNFFSIYSIKCNNKTAVTQNILIHATTSCVIGLFIIPSGSKYYENEDGEIVSDSIILKEMINIEDIGESKKLNELKDIKFK